MTLQPDWPPAWTEQNPLQQLCRDRLLPVLRDMERRGMKYGDWNWMDLANDLEELLK